MHVEESFHLGSSLMFYSIFNIIAAISLSFCDDNDHVTVVIWISTVGFVIMICTLEVLMSLCDITGLLTSCLFEAAACRLTLLPALRLFITPQQHHMCILEEVEETRLNLRITPPSVASTRP